MTTPPEPASMAVLLREAARMLLQWASVFDGVSGKDGVGHVATPLPTSDVPAITAPSSVPPTTTVPSIDPLPTAYVKQPFDEALLNAKSYERGWHDAAEQARHDDVASLPLTFRCPSCGQVRRWHMAKPPWPGAVCATCYAERQDHREGY